MRVGNRIQLHPTRHIRRHLIEWGSFTHLNPIVCVGAVKGGYLAIHKRKSQKRPGLSHHRRRNRNVSVLKGASINGLSREKCQRSSRRKCHDANVKTVGT